MMASDVEEEDLQSLRTAVLASLKTSEDSPAVTGEDSDDDDDDEDLEALRLAALQSLKAKSTPGDSVQPDVPPTGPTQGPPQRPQNQAGFPSHRRHPKRSNLIAINIVREESDNDLPLPIGGLPPTRGGRGRVPKIDRTVLPNEGRSSTPTKRNDKFSRFDNDSDSEEEILGGSSSSSSDGEEEDEVDLKESTSSESEKEEEEEVDHKESSSESEKEEERDVFDAEKDAEKSSDEAECNTKNEKEEENKDIEVVAEEIDVSSTKLVEEKPPDLDIQEETKDEFRAGSHAPVESDNSSKVTEHQRLEQNNGEPHNGKIENSHNPPLSEHEPEKVETQEDRPESRASSKSGSSSTSRSASPARSPSSPEISPSARSKSSVSFTTTSSDGSSSRSTSKSRSRSRSLSRSPSPAKQRKTRSLSRERFRRRTSCSRSRSRSIGRKVAQSPHRVARRRSQSPVRLSRNRSKSPVQLRRNKSKSPKQGLLDRQGSPVRSKRGRSLSKSRASRSLSRSRKRLRSRSQSPPRKVANRSGRSDSRSRRRGREEHRSRHLPAAYRRDALSFERNLARTLQKPQVRESERRTERRGLPSRPGERHKRNNLEKGDKTLKVTPDRTGDKASSFKGMEKPTDQKLEARKRKFEGREAKLEKQKVSLQGIVEKTDGLDSVNIKISPVEKERRKVSKVKPKKETRRISVKSESAGSSSSSMLSDSESESETEESRFRQTKKDVGEDSKEGRGLGLLRTTQVRTNIPDSLDPWDRRRQDRDRNGPDRSGFPRDRHQRPRDRHRDRRNTRRHSPNNSQEAQHRSRDRDRTELKRKVATLDKADRVPHSPPKKIKKTFRPEKESKSGSSSEGNGEQPKIKSLLSLNVSPPKSVTPKPSVSPEPMQDKREIVEDVLRQSPEVKAVKVVKRKVQVKRIVLSDTTGADSMDGSDLRVRILQRKTVESGGEEDGRKKKKRERGVKRKISITSDEVNSAVPDPSEDVSIKRKSIHERLGLQSKVQRQAPQQAISRQQIQIKIKRDVPRDLDAPATTRKQSPAPSSSKKPPPQLEVRPDESELDARIRLIQQKNAAILQRKKEIEMDKKRYGN
ncbi:Hypp7779 [Branchiostoma lanceolatum]|uniref:Hypp7779 protein n=1 Tax=Branchiostoma lanceolatum TaxID=7740 RepID=A0A8J9Z3R1_BRALA|nr:Hypp7779 [Branchiostoma lanceolatum]